MPERNTITRVTRTIAIVISISVAAIMPTGYFFLSYQNLVGGLETEVELTASTVSKAISLNPNAWEYEQARFREILTRQLQHRNQVSLTIFNGLNSPVTQIVRQGSTAPPLIIRTFNVYDAGEVAGRIEIRASLRPLLLRAGVVAVIGFTLGLAVFATLQLLPLRSINRIEASLRQSNISLEERTAELTATNLQLIREVEARKAAEKQLQYNAFHDVLTTLPNRALFLERLNHAMAITKRSPDYRFAVFFMDLDRFKIINDSLGHMVGDELLIQVGHRLQECLRPGDTVGRFGGDEFAVLLENIRDQASLQAILSRIEQEFDKPFKLSDHEVFTTLSIGVATCGNGCLTPEQILGDADTAMYNAKMSGGGKSLYFETGMRARIVERLQIETDIRKALEHNEFVVFYQPIFSLVTDSLVGYEALVRWEHPERGLLYPGDFFSIAEDMGVIVQIDRLVLRQACRQLHEWQLEFPKSSGKFVSVNLSNRQIVQPDLFAHISRIIEETKIDPRNLRLEINENVILEQPEHTANVVSQLKSLGVKIYIDDFGMGYSVLNYLQNLPIEGLKIDRSFIRKMGNHEKSDNIISTILLLAQNMNMDVIAEGVETLEQLSKIKSLNCQYGQGYLFSKPVESDQARAFLAANGEHLLDQGT